MKQRVSIQGFEGSFHQIAAETFFGSGVEVATCPNFRDVVSLTQNGETFAGVMAIENSIAGSILPNYILLQNADLSIVGEVYLPIDQHLLVFPGVRLEDIREVNSHPMAIQQCMDYLTRHTWKLVETEDTALSAKRIAERKSQHAAAIAGKLAAELFDLEILAKSIQTEPHNYTRFLVLQKSAATIQDANKASVSFETDHSKGSLARVLSMIAEGGINLSKLQSFPIPGSHWKYMFHADMEFDTPDTFYKVIKTIQPSVEGIKILGIYKNGQSENL